ncbi:MAG: hypothetical protein KC449_11700, partial [Anaerolineales bacterium]|nr:hypothetical protein [Anaerolineales bacterium]
NIVNGLPICTEFVNPAELLGPDVTIPACLPPGVPAEQVAQEVHTRLVQTIDSNPQLTSEFGVVRVPLFSPEQQAQNAELVQAREQLMRLQRIFSLAKDWGWLLWLLPAGCLALIVLLAVRSWSEWGMWWGWPLVGTAVFVLLLTLVAPTITFAMVRQVPPNPGFDTILLRQTLFRLVTAVTDTWQSRVNVQAAIMLILGLVFVLFGYLTRPKNTV